MKHNVFSQKICLATALLALLASPLAFSSISIEVNKDRSIGMDAFDRAQSTMMSPHLPFSLNELTYDKGDKQLSRHFFPMDYQASAKNTSISPMDLTRDVGDGLYW